MRVAGVAQNFGCRRQAKLLAVEARISSETAAPSEMAFAFAAVTVPSWRKAGFNCGVLSSCAFSGCSSFSLVSVRPRPVMVMVMGSISHLKAPSWMAFCARFVDSMASSS